MKPLVIEWWVWGGVGVGVETTAKIKRR